MYAVKSIELFYLFFQGILIFQVVIFLVLFRITKKKDIVFYALFLFFAAAYFFLNAPFTFFGISEALVFQSKFYAYVNIPLIIIENYFYLLFLQYFYKGLTNDMVVENTLRYTLLIIPVLILFFVVVTIAGTDTQAIYYTVKLLAVIPAIVICYMLWNKKLPFFNLMLGGLTCTIAGTLLTVCMIILRNNGVHHILTYGYPLIFIRMGLLGDMIFYLAAILKKWHLQEKELAVQQVQKKLEIANIRNKISSQLHDDIGSTLSGVSMYSYLADSQMLNGEHEKLKTTLQTIQRSSNEVIGKLGDLVWSVKTENLSMDTLVEKLIHYGQEMCNAKNIEFCINVPSHLESIVISEEQNYHIYLCLKEAINNAVKYSEASKLELSIKESTNRIEFSIADNGKGIPNSISHKGNGLENMKQRAENIGAAFEFESGQGKGVCIRLVIRIPH